MNDIVERLTETRKWFVWVVRDALWFRDENKTNLHNDIKVAAETIESLRIENECLKAAFWMVGNNDTPEDVDAWWRQFGDMWNEMFADDKEKEKAQKTSTDMWKQSVERQNQ